MRIPCRACFDNDICITPYAETCQVLMDYTGCQQSMDGEQVRFMVIIGEQQNNRTTVDRICSLITDSLKGCAQVFLPWVMIEFEPFNRIAPFIKINQRLEAAGGKDRGTQLDPICMLFRFFKD